MALQTKIKHIDKRPNGVLRFRRRFPKDVSEALGESFLQVHVRNTKGLAFHREYQAIMDEFDRIVRDTRERLQQEGRDDRTTQRKWHDALIAAAGLKEGITGLDPEDPETGRLIIQSMKKKPEPMLAKALVFPSAPPPKPTLGDAIKLYRKDKQIKEGSKQDGDLNRIVERLTAALGDLEKLPLEEMAVEHRRRYLDHMLNAKKADGSPLALGSAKKENNIVVALVNHALTELDLSARNRFADLPWPKETVTPLDKKQPLPDELVSAMDTRLAGARNLELPLIWTILAATGARLGEVVGLTVGDLRLDADIPHLLIQPNAIRGLKTTSSIRSVPLTVPAQEALKEAVAAASSTDASAPLFARYASPRGADAASAVLMKHLREETKDKQFTVHGLRHRVSDKLREAGAPTEVRQGFLGHANQAVAETTYGGREARLREFLKWAEKAGL